MYQMLRKIKKHNLYKMSEKHGRISRNRAKTRKYAILKL